MFSDNKKGKTITPKTTLQNTIGQGTVITGDIVSEGDFRIEGTLKGNIVTSGKVVIGKTGAFTGILKSTNADIEGRLTGKINLNETLTLRASAFVEGEVEVGKLAVEPGSTFNATCVMKSSVKDLKNEGRKEKSA